jgi:hypothetical protein
VGVDPWHIGKPEAIRGIKIDIEQRHWPIWPWSISISISTILVLDNLTLTFLDIITHGHLPYIASISSLESVPFPDPFQRDSEDLSCEVHPLGRISYRPEIFACFSETTADFGHRFVILLYPFLSCLIGIC